MSLTILCIIVGVIAGVGIVLIILKKIGQQEAEPTWGWKEMMEDVEEEEEEEE